MITAPFTKPVLTSLSPKVKRYAIKDHKTPGLRLVVYPTGMKVFQLYRKIHGRPQHIKIGNFTDLSIENARKIASQHNGEIAAGKNPYLGILKKKRELTFRQLYDFYLKEHALVNTKRPEANRKTIEYHVMPILGDVKQSDLTKDIIRKLFLSIGEKTTMANAGRVMRIVSAVFNHNLKAERFTGKNPCSDLPKTKLRSRDRFLSSSEMQRFFQSVREEESIFRDFFMLLLFTGARKSNVLSMAWKDIDLDLKQWRIPEKLTKNGDINIVYLPEVAITILRERFAVRKHLGCISPFVFPGEGRNGYLNDPKKAFSRICKRMEIQDFRMHDLRRTLGSYMAINGSSLLTIGKALNHKSTASTEIYARLSQNHIIDAVNGAANRMTICYEQDGKTVI